MSEEKIMNVNGNEIPESAIEELSNGKGEDE